MLKKYILNTIVLMCILLCIPLLTAFKMNPRVDTNYELPTVSVNTEKLIASQPAIEVGGKPLVVNRIMHRVSIHKAGKCTDYYTSESKLSAFLKKSGIVLGEGDMVFPSMEMKLKKSNDISIINYASKQVEKVEVIPFETVETKSEEHPIGQQIVETTGENGSKTVVINQKYRDGVLIAEEKVSEVVTKEPVKQSVLVGDSEFLTTTNEANLSGMSSEENMNSKPTESFNGGSGGSDMGFSYSYVIEMSATAYDASVADGIPYTATGSIARPGVIAVDPSVIPLGTVVYIESLDGWPSYGYAVAEDTGSAIVGNIIDLFYDSHQTALDFGRRSVRVYILN